MGVSCCGFTFDLLFLNLSFCKLSFSLLLSFCLGIDELEGSLLNGLIDNLGTCSDEPVDEEEEDDAWFIDSAREDLGRMISPSSTSSGWVPGFLFDLSVV